MPKLLPPSKLGLPERFDPWRPQQEKAIITALQSDARFIALALPTGAGKSLVGVASAVIPNERAVYVTSTKGLQDQVGSDFIATGLVADLRGKNNYPCALLQGEAERMIAESGFAPEGYDRSALSAEAGPCQSRMPCEWKAGGCAYYDQVRIAARKQIILQNYAKWLAYPSREQFEEELGRVELLILDEAHETESWLEKAVECELTFKELDEYLALEPHPSVKDKPSMWIEWGRRALPLVRVENQNVESALQNRGDGSDGSPASAGKSGKSLSKLYKRAKELRSLLRRIERLASGGGDWVVEQVGRGDRAGVKASPVWPTAWAEKMLFRGIEKVILMSATIRPKTLDLLGVPRDDRLFLELPSDFPLSRRPIYPVKCARMGRGSSTEDHRKWMEAQDAIHRARRDRKGLVFTVSYDRAQTISKLSTERARMMTHDSKTTRQTVRRFKALPDRTGAVLASPSIDTGWDFPGTTAEYGIIAKVPFVNPTSPLYKARVRKDPEYADYLVAKKLVQSAGRGMRSKKDSFETFVTDDHFWWFLWKNKHLFPQFFIDAVYKPCDVSRLPEPLPKLSGEVRDEENEEEGDFDGNGQEDQGWTRQLGIALDGLLPGAGAHSEPEPGRIERSDERDDGEGAGDE